MSSDRKYGWGLIGPGRFAREFADELGDVRRARLVAVASRSLEKAEAFADDFGFEKAYGSYEEILADDEVEIVYIVVPHVFHREIAEMAIAAGKAVICEKPLTPSAADTRALTEVAREAGVFLMEAMKVGFLPVIQKAKEWIDEGRIGTPQLARADFSFFGPQDPEDRLMNPDLAGGAVLDVGIYPIHLTRFLLGEVEEIHAVGTSASTGVEKSVAMIAKHAGGASSAMTCSFRAEGEKDALILGTEGAIFFPLFHRGGRVELIKDEEVIEIFENEAGGVLRWEIVAVMDALDEGLLEVSIHSHADSVRLAELMDAVRGMV